MESKKKILFLSMTCREQFFVDQTKIVKETWAKDIIDGKYGENVQFLSYDGWNEQFELDRDNNILHVRAEDNDTFKKTYYALKVLQNNFDYDYIFRTNTSTFINVPLAIAFINSLDDNDEVLWSSELLSLIEAPVPYPLDIYGRGNGLIMSRKIINILLKEGINLLYLEQCDDWMIGNALNGYYIKNGKNYLDHLKSFKHGWFKCVDVKDSTNNHQLCQYWNENTDYDFLKQFITIQIKQYYSRENEINNYKELNEIFIGKEDNNIQETVESNKSYSKNPSIFLGSIIGYLSMETFNTFSKSELWKLEAEHKADNDIFKDKYKGKPWL